MQKVRDDFANSINTSSVKTVRPIHSNFVAYVKELLAIENVELAKASMYSGETTGILYSNSTDLSIRPISNKAISVNFTLNESAIISLNLLDLSGNIICNPIKGNKLERGSHAFTLACNKSGVYLVQLIINGHVNVKKVIVE